MAKRKPNGTEWWIVGGVFGLVLAGIAGAAIIERRRVRILGETLRAAGFEANTKPAPDDKSAPFGDIGSLRMLRTGAKGVQWFARAQLNDRPVLLLEHRYTTGAGKSRQVHYHTVAATPAPSAWPALRVVEENLFHKIAELFGSRDIKVESEAFNKRWRVTCDSEEFATLVLSPEVQQWGMGLKRGVQLHVGGGAICVVRRTRVDGGQALELARLAAELAAMLPPELQAWGG